MTQGTHLIHPATCDSIAQALSLAIHEHKIAPGTKLGEDELGDKSVPMPQAGPASLAALGAVLSSDASSKSSIRISAMSSHMPVGYSEEASLLNFPSVEFQPRIGL